MTQSNAQGETSCLVVLVVIAFVLAALFGLIGGVMALTGESSPIGITIMNIFMTPLFLFLLVGGLRDLGKKTGAGRWFRLASSGAMLAVMVGAGAFNAIRLGTCGQRLVAGGNLIGCNFSGDDLSGLDLHGADLAFANLTGADLTGTNLQSVRFDDTDLTGTIGLSDETLARYLGVGIDDLGAATARQAIHLESRTSLQEALAGVCAGHAAPGARLGISEQSFHTVMVLDADGSSSSAWGESVRLARWEPMALRFTDLVACIAEQEKVALNSCHYSGGSTITRYRYQVHVRLMEAATGGLVAEETIYGGEPGSCPSSTSGGTASVNGKKVLQDHLTDWLAKRVHPPEE